MPDGEIEEVWFAGDGSAPEKTQKVAGAAYPLTDVEGRPLFVNTHFDTEKEAWEYLLKNAEAGMSMAQRDYEQAKRTVETAKTELAEDASRVVQIRDGYEKFLEANPEKA